MQNKIITISFMILFGIASYFEPLYLIPGTLFALLVSALIVKESIAPDMDYRVKMENRLSQLEQTVSSIKLSKMR